MTIAWSVYRAAGPVISITSVLRKFACEGKRAPDYSGLSSGPNHSRRRMLASEVTCQADLVPGMQGTAPFLNLKMRAVPQGGQAAKATGRHITTTLHNVIHATDPRLQCVWLRVAVGIAEGGQQQGPSSILPLAAVSHWKVPNAHTWFIRALVSALPRAEGATRRMLCCTTHTSVP